MLIKNCNTGNITLRRLTLKGITLWSIPKILTLKHVILKIVTLTIILLLLSPNIASGGCTDEEILNLDHLNYLNEEMVNLDHLNYLNEEITIDGIEMAITHIYADAPDYNWTDAPGEGIACVDDTARSAVVYLKHFQYYHDRHSLEMARKNLLFLLFMQAEDGEFYNFINSDLSINKYGGSSFKTYSWWAARAVWAMGLGYRVFLEEDPEFAGRLQSALRKSITAAQNYMGPDEIKITHGFEMPLCLIRGEADISAITVMGLLEYYQASPEEEIKKLITVLVDGIVQTQHGDFTSYPFNRYTSHINSLANWHQWGSRQTQAVARAAWMFNNPSWLESARNSAESWLSTLVIDGHLYRITPAVVRYEQIAYAVNPVVQAYLELYRATGIEKYAMMAGVAASWYLGNNPAGVKMYNSLTGMTYDGINGRGLYNQNSGAESTIEGLLSIMEVMQNPTAAEFVQYNQPVEKNRTIRVEAELGRIVSGNPVINHGNSGGSQGEYSQGRFIGIRNGDRVDYTLNLAEGEDYLVYLVYARQAGANSGFQLELLIDGDSRGMFHYTGDGVDEEHLWMEQIEIDRAAVNREGIHLEKGRHTISLVGTQSSGHIESTGFVESSSIANSSVIAKSSQTEKASMAKIDQIVLQPVEQYMILEDSNGERIRVWKDYMKECFEIRIESGEI